jgi:RNA polymerase sigma-70 factor (ECF subfamily)
VDDLKNITFPDRIRRCALAIQKRGITALGALYDLSAQRVLRYAYTMTRNQADAEDVLQAAMTKIALNPKNLAQAQHPWAYFLKVVRNEAIRLLRKKKAQAIDSAVLDQRAADPEKIVEEELKQLVNLALQKLPAEQAEVVVLKIWEGMTFAEIGQVLDQSPNTVASRYRYAINKLAVSLQQFSGEVTHG